MADTTRVPMDRLHVTYGLYTPERVTIYWEREEGTDNWTASRTKPGEPHTRVPHFDCDNMLDVFKWMRDILAGRIGDYTLRG